MTVKNTLLGGTDWILGESLFTTDLKDTFDELYNLVNP